MNKRMDTLEKNTEKKFENHTKALDKRLGGLYNNDQMITQHIIDLKEHVAKQNGGIELAKTTAASADVKATDVDKRVSSLTLKVLLAVIVAVIGGAGLLITVLTHLSK